MARNKDILEKIEKFDYNIFNLAEAFIEREEELLEEISNLEEKISDLEEEIGDHTCNE